MKPSAHHVCRRLLLIALVVFRAATVSAATAEPDANTSGLPPPAIMTNFVIYLASEGVVRQEVSAEISYLYQQLGIAYLRNLHVDLLEQGTGVKDTLDAPEGYLYLQDFTPAVTEEEAKKARQAAREARQAAEQARQAAEKAKQGDQEAKQADEKVKQADEKVKQRRDERVKEDTRIRPDFPFYKQIGGKEANAELATTTTRPAPMLPAEVTRYRNDIDLIGTAQNHIHYRRSDGSVATALRAYRDARLSRIYGWGEAEMQKPSSDGNQASVMKGRAFVSDDSAKGISIRGGPMMKGAPESEKKAPER